MACISGIIYVTEGEFMIVASIFQVLIVKPIFNLLVFIYALLPGHNFGLAIILFTVIVRFLMWPLVKKQLHQAKLTRELQPELKRIKAAANGDKQKEQMMMLELYKERGISPFSSLGTIIVQFLILIGLYSGLNNVIKDPQALVTNAYSWISNLSWLETIGQDISKFDNTLFGFIDLTRAAINQGGGIYWPAMTLVVLSAAIQYLTSKQLIPRSKDGRNLKRILKDAGEGKHADQAEVAAAVNRGMIYFIPGMIFLFTINLPSALSLYWFVGGIVAYFQQARILGQDEREMEAIADKPDSTVIEGEVVNKKESKSPNQKSKTKKSTKKRRKK